MKFQKTKIKGVYVIKPEILEDRRGYFSRIFCKKEFANLGVTFDIVQANRSFTKKKGAIRGLHYQNFPHWEDKIMQCLKGDIYVVVLDLRKKSKTFGKWISERLSEKNKKMILVPKGCANGFQTMVNNCQVEYFMSKYYLSESGAGVRWDDSFFKIKWPLKRIFLSEKDKNWKDYNDIVKQKI